MKVGEIVEVCLSRNLLKRADQGHLVVKMAASLGPENILAGYPLTATDASWLA